MKMFCSFLLLTMYCLAGISLQAQNITTPNIKGPGGVSVNSYTGNLYYKRTDFLLAGRTPLNISFSYNSTNRDIKQGFGWGWTFYYGMQIKEDAAKNVTVVRSDGSEDFYNYSQTYNIFYAPQGVFDVLTKNGTGTYLLHAKDGTNYYFNDPVHKYLTRQEDKNGNALAFSYNDTLFASISDDAGRSIQFKSSNGHIDSVIDANGDLRRAYKYDYDNTGNLVKVTDPMGNTLQYGYVLNGPLNSLTDKNKNVVDVVYNESFAVNEIISCLTHQTINYNTITGTTSLSELVGNSNQLTTYNFDVNGNLVKKSGTCCGYNVQYVYDKDKNLSKMIDANGHQSQYTYDGNGNLVSQTDALGNTTTYSYDFVSGKLASYRDRNGNLFQYSYDGSGNLVSALYPLNINNKYLYSAKGDLISTTDGNGNVTNYTYDKYGNVNTVVNTGLGVTTTLQYNEKSQLVKTINPNGHTTARIFDALGRITSVTDALNKTIKFDYDANNNISVITDKNGHFTRYGYDPLNRPISITDPLGGESDFAYNSKNKIIAATDAEGHTTTFAYDSKNMLISKTNAAGEAVSYQYDPAGNTTAITSVNGNTVSATYDALNRVVQLSDNVGKSYSYTYDNIGNVLTTTDGNGFVVTSTYDPLKRKISQTDALGNMQNYTYDRNFNLTAITDRNHGTNTLTYDALNRRIAATDPLGHVTKFAFDKSSNLDSIIDANGNITAYTYDQLDHNTKIKFADGSENTLAYDAMRNVTNLVTANGDAISYVYDANNRVINKVLGDTDRYVYGYSKTGKLMSAVNANAALAFQYNEANRITSESLNGKTTSYAYDMQGNKLTIGYPTGEQYQYVYDLRNNISKIQNQDGSTLASFVYDNGNRLLSRKYPSNKTSTDYTYNSNDQVISLLVNPGSKINSVYTYDNAGNKLSEKKNHRPDRSEQFKYDGSMRLIGYVTGTMTGNTITPKSTMQYNYDALGNRTSVVSDTGTINYTSNQVNEYTVVKGATQVSPVYDKNGNLISDGTFAYNYNVENKLIAVNNGTVASYKYDALGRRIQKKVGSSVVNSFYSRFEMIAASDSANHSNSSFVYGPAIDDVLAANLNGKQYYYYKNQLASVVAVADTSGSVVERYDYEPFGKTSIFDGNYNGIPASAIGNTTYYTGRSFDVETGKYNYRQRQYDQNAGRFLQRDPFSYLAGDFNLYTYAVNLPTRLSDPYGTSCSEPSKPSEISKADILNNTAALEGEILETGTKGLEKTIDVLKQGLGTGSAVDAVEHEIGVGKLFGGVMGPLIGLPSALVSVGESYKAMSEENNAAHVFDFALASTALTVSLLGAVVATGVATLPFLAFPAVVAAAASVLFVAGVVDLATKAIDHKSLGEELFGSSGECH